MGFSLSQKNSKGFTLIEVMVIILIISILASVAISTYNSARKSARDKQRITDLQQLQVALRLYKDAYGNYPETCGGGWYNARWAGPGPGPSGSSGWYRNCDAVGDYITGLAPEYVPKLPLDPTRESEAGYGYMYSVSSDGLNYKVIVNNVEGGSVSAGQPYAKCPSSCCTGSVCTTGQCKPTGTYAIYSSGAACW